MRKTFTSFAAALATATVVFAAPAMAQDPSADVTITVQTDDLDLSNPADQDTLDARIETAIRQACRTGGRDMASRKVEKACRANLSEALGSQVDVAIADANTKHFASLDLDIEA